MEAKVYVRHGSPWIAAHCPCCGEYLGLSPEQKFCSECGTQLSYKNYEIVVATGGTVATGNWHECVLLPEMRKNHLIKKLSNLEKEIGVEETPIIKIMREAYIRTLFESKRI